MQPVLARSPPAAAAKSLWSPKSPSDRQHRGKRRVLVAHACRNGPCRVLVQALILAFLMCALGLMGYSLHLRLYSTKLASMSSSPSMDDNQPEGTRKLLASMRESADPMPSSLSPLAAVRNRSLLLFSVLRDYSPQFAAAAPVDHSHYTLALTSWLSLSNSVASAAAAGSKNRGPYSVGRLDVVLFVDSNESCDFVRETWPTVVCRVSGSLRNDSSGQSTGCMHQLSTGARPYMSCIWQHIANHSRSSGRHYDDIAYVNGDILLFPSLLDTLAVVHRTYPAANASYAVITRRRDASFATLTAAALAPKQLPLTQRLFSASNASGSGSSGAGDGSGGSQVHGSFGIDAFLISSSLYSSIAGSFPDLLVGSPRWDNWLLATLLRDSSAARPVIDATAGWVAGHDSVQSDHEADEGRKWNEALVKRSMGKWWWLGTADNADVRLTAGGGAGNGSAEAGLRLEVNSAERKELYLYRYISIKQSREQQLQQAEGSQV